MTGERFPRGQERKSRAQSAQNSASQLAGEGRRGLRQWSYRDSRLQGGWKILGATFEETFSRCLPEGEKDLKLYIEHVLADRAGKAVGAEFGGPGSKLFADFSKGFFARTFGMTLIDGRKSRKEFARDRDRNHEVLTGNITNKDSYDKIQAPVDVIFERLAEGFEYVAKDPFLFARIFNVWYRMLSDRGVMFVQVPMVLQPLMSEWLQLVTEKVSDKTLEIQYSPNLGGALDSRPWNAPVLRIRKLARAPAELPMLDPRIVGKVDSIRRIDLLEGV